MLPKLMIPIVVLTAAGFFMSVDLASGSSNGISGYSGNPATNGGASCSSCHSGGAVPSVTLTGPSTVTAGSTSTYTLTITGGQATAGGLDVSATTGNLISTAADTKLSASEIVQNGAKAADGAGAVSWTFDWTAPASAGSATLYGAGNSVNLAAGTGGDAAATTSLGITVQASTNQLPTAVTGGPYTGAALTGITVDGSGSSDPDGTITAYQWDFGDGGAVVDFGTAGVTLQHSYPLDGTYTVSLTVVDDVGGTATSTTTATIGTGVTPSTTTTTTAPPVVDAGAIYGANCAGCHGGSGGGGVGPSLVASTASVSQIAGIISGGAAGMPGFGASLTPAEIDAVAALAAGFQSSTPTSTTTTTLPAAATGADIYSSNCASCHGAGGGGGIGPSLIAKPANAVIVSSIVTSGIGAMPGFGSKLTAKQIQLVSEHVVKISPAPPTTTTTVSTGDGSTPVAPPPVSGSAVYGTYCASCHGASGEGGVGPSLIASKSSFGQISTVVGSGRGSMPGFGPVITADEIAAVSRHAAALQSAEPVAATPTTLPTAATGADVYGANCAACHGPAGAGGVGPSLIDAPASVGLVKSIVTTGIGTMPGFSGKLSAGQIQLVAQHIASIAPSAGSGSTASTGAESTGSPADAAAATKPAGATLFAANCASCHGANGEGGVGDDLRVKFFDDDLISDINRGPGDMPGFADILSEAEIRLIADHVHTFDPTVTTKVAGAVELPSAVKKPAGPSQASLDINKRLAAAPDPTSESPNGFPIGLGILLLLAAAGGAAAWIILGERMQHQLHSEKSP